MFLCYKHKLLWITSFLGVVYSLSRTTTTGRTLFRNEMNVKLFSSNGEVITEDQAILNQRFEKLKGMFIEATFSGFDGVNGMMCNIELNKDFSVAFSGGLENSKPGFWRASKLDNGAETIEATQPVLPEYMLFFDLWESQIIWKGTLDFESMRVTDGEVITNKKRFGIVPYQDILATFEGQIKPMSEKKPEPTYPAFNEQQFLPPDGFEDPNDMQRYPEIFDPEFAEWWYDAESALARGENPPPRPKVYFSPKGSADAVSPDDTPTNDLKAARAAKTKNGRGMGKKAF